MTSASPCRAAATEQPLFGLGVLLALVDQHLNQRVTSISSVSGGSIANGIAASGPDFGTVETEEFERHIAGALSTISDRGLLLGGAPATRGYMRMLIVTACAALVGRVGGHRRVSSVIGGSSP